MHFNLFSTLALVAAAAFFNPAHAQQPQIVEDKIVAVVNDHVITGSDLKARTNMTRIKLNLQNLSAGQEAQLLQQSLASMVDEELQRQYAQQRGITVNPAELEQGRAIIARNMQIDLETYKKRTEPIKAADDDKLAAEIRWQKIIERAIRPTINISTMEIDRLIEEMLRNNIVQEREVARIIMDAPDAQAQLSQIKQDIENDKISFAQAARAFSTGPAAARGGNLGWFTVGELNPQLEEKLNALTQNEISNPIQTEQGWQLLTILNAKESGRVSTKPITELNIWHIILEGEDPSRDNRRLLRAIRNQNTFDTEAFEETFTTLTQNEAFTQSTHMGWTDIETLTPQLKNQLLRLRGNGATREFKTDKGTELYVLTDARTVLPDNLEEYRARVRERLTENRLDLASRRFLRELREHAFIDVRLND